jgi:hypothetical protein
MSFHVFLTVVFVSKQEMEYYTTHVKVRYIFFSQDLAVETETSQLLTHQSFLLEQSRRIDKFIRVTLYSSAVLYSCTVQLLCTAVHHRCSVQLYIAAVLYSCTVQRLCTAVQCRRLKKCLFMCSLQLSLFPNRKWNYYTTHVKVRHIFFSKDLCVETETSQLLTHQSFLLEQ